MRRVVNSWPRALTISLVAAFVVLVVIAARPGERASDAFRSFLETRFERTPLRAVPRLTRLLPATASNRFGLATINVDVDGSGREQIFYNVFNGIGLLGHDGTSLLTRDQINLPPLFASREPFASLYGPYDIDGDGFSEVVAVAPSHDRAEWRLWVLDVDGQQVKARMTLPHGSDERRPDGVWDGNYVPIGAVAVPGLPHPAILLVCQVLFDVDGRGVLAVDPVAGEAIWRFAMGTDLSRDEVHVVDIDGDGAPEIVVGAWAPHNLRGVPINHTSDDSSRVFVIGADGQLRWTRTLGGNHAGGRVAVGDLDGDGAVEIVTATQDPTAATGRLSVWSATGTLLDDRREPGPRPYRAVVQDAAGDGRLHVVVIYDETLLRSYRWDGRQLHDVATRSLAPGSGLLPSIELGPAWPGQQVVASEPDRVLLLDGRLRTLAMVPTDHGQLKVPALVWRARQDLRYLVLRGAAGNMYEFARQPLVPLWAWAVAAAALGLLIAGFRFLALALVALAGRLLWPGRRRGAPATVETDPAVLRALRREMLGMLEKGGHEKIGVLKSLRRLVWNLDAAVSISLAAPTHPAEGGVGPAGPATQRALAAAGSFRQESLPLLREVLSLARRTAIAPHLALTCEEILDEVEALLEPGQLVARPLGEVFADAERLNNDAEMALQRLRRAVEETFCCSLPRAVVRVLEAQSDALRAAGVLVEISGGDSAGAAPWVHIDPPDLEFILDNLVGNAIRAMADAPRKVLCFGWTSEPGRVVCTVSDTGWGIAPEDWERIFEPGASDRAGGGVGLSRSRHELAIYGGSLKVQASQPGRGTTFVLQLPPARAVACADGDHRLRIIDQEGEA